jgi:hypothetical protein
LATEKKSFLLRIDPALWSALEKLAAAEVRSVNGQIEFLLRDAVTKRGVAVDSGAGDNVSPVRSKRNVGDDSP